MKRIGFLAVVVLPIFACQPAVQQAGLAEEDRAAINAMISDLVDAELAGDYETVAGMMVADVVSMPSNMPLIEGRDAWSAWVESMGFAVTDLAVDIVEMDGRGDLAYLRMTYTESLTVEGASEPIDEVGKCLWLVRKQADGSWLLSTWICNSDLPAAESGTEN
jgi:uncharacterized protein (TIGR02246 family)